MAIVFNYGGGRQTVAMCILIANNTLPRPDRIVIADTSRENPMTWEYLDKYTQPLMKSIGLEIEIASHDLASVDLYAKNSQLLLPAWTNTGILRAWCSGEWKRDVVERHIKATGIKQWTVWLGLSFDEKKRWKRSQGTTRHNVTVECPLVDRLIGTAECLKIIRKAGWPEPHVSSCWMCPHKRNSEWRHIRDNYPGKFQQACEIDEKIRQRDVLGGAWLHRSKIPLAEADLSSSPNKGDTQQCMLGNCFV